MCQVVRHLEGTDEQDGQDPCFHRAFSPVEEPKCKKVFKDCALGAIRKLTSSSSSERPSQKQ